MQARNEWLSPRSGLRNGLRICEDLQSGDGGTHLSVSLLHLIDRTGPWTWFTRMVPSRGTYDVVLSYTTARRTSRARQSLYKGAVHQDAIPPWALKCWMSAMENLTRSKVLTRWSRTLPLKTFGFSPVPHSGLAVLSWPSHDHQAPVLSRCFSPELWW